jgi:hypothetical protein
VGEYAFLGEMAGTIPLRGTSERLEPAVLNKPLGATKDGTATHTGYHYRIYLPAANGSGALCESNASDGKDVSAERAEASFTAYAWPVDAGTTANRVWVMHNYLLYECEDPNGKYSGLEHAPRFDSSWPAERGVDREDGTPYVGKDGLTWQLVE